MSPTPDPRQDEPFQSTIRTARTIGKAAAAIDSRRLEGAIDTAQANLIRGNHSDQLHAELELLRALSRYRIDLEELAALALDVPLVPDVTPDPRARRAA